ncbi:MAG TPA: hypothetical protein VF824_12000 [Thermoanaerobaculia bacterium]
MLQHDHRLEARSSVRRKAKDAAARCENPFIVPRATIIAVETRSSSRRNADDNAAVGRQTVHRSSFIVHRASARSSSRQRDHNPFIVHRAPPHDHRGRNAMIVTPQRTR